MTTINSETLDQFCTLVAAFKYEEAEKQFYHTDLVKHENEDPPTIGLQAHHREMQHFLSKISNEKATCLNTLRSDDLSVVEWFYEFEHQDWGKRAFKQISVQRWKDGKIIHERHHYKTDQW